MWCAVFLTTNNFQPDQLDPTENLPCNTNEKIFHNIIGWSSRNLCNSLKSGLGCNVSERFALCSPRSSPSNSVLVFVFFSENIFLVRRVRVLTHLQRLQFSSLPKGKATNYQCHITFNLNSKRLEFCVLTIFQIKVMDLFASLYIYITLYFIQFYSVIVRKLRWLGWRIWFTSHTCLLYSHILFACFFFRLTRECIYWDILISIFEYREILVKEFVNKWTDNKKNTQMQFEK